MLCGTEGEGGFGVLDATLEGVVLEEEEVVVSGLVCLAGDIFAGYLLMG